MPDAPTRSPLISAADLRALLSSDPDRVRIVDCRWYLGRPGDGHAAWAAGHHPLPSPAAFADRLGAAGIGVEHLVVAYDDVGGWVAARLWWMLDVLGHRDAAVLDGGIVAWTAAGGTLSTEAPAWPPASLHLAEAWTGVISREELKARVGSVVLLDARAPGRYRGEVEPIDPVAGHIPTARNVPVDGNLADGRFRPPAEL